MKKYRHEESPLGSYKREWGNLLHVIAPADNSSMLLFTQEGDQSWPTKERLVFNGKIMVEKEPMKDGLLDYDLSPDGTKLAWEDRGDIFVNGEKRYHCDIEELHNLSWLSNEDLVWIGWKDEKLCYYKNGEETTGRFEFERFSGGFWITDWEKEVSYALLENGRTTNLGPPMRLAAYRYRSDWRNTDPEPPKIEEGLNEKKNRIFISYNNVAGPEFHMIESKIFSEDYSQLGYCGISYPKPAAFIGGLVERLMEWSLAEEEKESPFKYILKGAIGWPLTLLFNPYFGIGTILLENSKRFTPVNHPKPWKNSYKYAHIHCFTARNEMVVIAKNEKIRVVIDEEEGPGFDGIHNLKYLKDKEMISYIGQRGNDFYRVAVK